MQINLVYIVSTLKRCGPNRQLFYIIKYLDRNTFEPAIITLSPEEKDSMIDEFKEICPAIHGIQMNRLKGIFMAGKVLRKKLAQWDHPVIHSQGIRPDYYNAVFLKKYPRIATLRNYPFMDYPYKYGTWKGKIMARLHLRFLSAIDKAYTNSEASSRILEEKHHIHVSYINNGIEAASFIPEQEVRKSMRNKLKIAENAKLFLSIGHLTRQKDPFTVINGFLKSALDKEDKLILLGDGQLLHACKEMASTNKRIIVAGRVKNVADYIKAADYFISASLTEGLPNSVLEAMAGGLPLILSDILPHRLILEKSTECGESFKLADSDNLADVINRIISKNRTELQSNCIYAAKKHYSAEQLSLRYQQAYKSLSETKQLSF